MSFAWTQGAQAIAAEWVAVINNDVVMPAQWLENLIAFATTHRVDIASPAMCEGNPLSPYLQPTADQFMARMALVCAGLRLRRVLHGPPPGF